MGSETETSRSSRRSRADSYPLTAVGFKLLTSKLSAGSFEIRSLKPAVHSRWPHSHPPTTTNLSLLSPRFVAAALVAAALFTPLARADAQDYVAATWLYLRRSPNDTAARLRTLHPGDTLHARDAGVTRPGWLAVRTMDGKAGWVGEVYVRSIAVMDAAAGTAVLARPDGSAFPRIDPAWARPPLQQSTIRVQGGAVPCGPVGDAPDDDGTNLHKNRADIPGQSHLVTADAIRSLPDTVLWRFTNRKHWAAADSAVVIPYEGIPLTVEGYFEVVKPQQTSAPASGKKVGESPNCHSWAEMDTDWHVALVADPSETEERAVVVEPTPRTKRHNASWDVATVSALAVRRTPSSPRNEAGAARVRVTGFLLLDPVHPTHIRGTCTSACAGKKFYRATLWEIHPVTRIEVFRGGKWVDLNEP